MTLKPVSDAMRSALALLGETPEEHQKEQLFRTKTVKANAPNARQLNQTNFARRSMSAKERAEESDRLFYAAQRARPEMPDARVMFMEQIHCKSCGTVAETPRFPHVFLRMRKVQGGRLDLSSASYIPEPPGPQQASPPRLPRIIDFHRVEVSSCQRCFIPSLQVESTESRPSDCTPPTLEKSEPISSNSSASESSSELLEPLSALVEEQELVASSTTPSSPTPSTESQSKNLMLSLEDITQGLGSSEMLTLLPDVLALG